jgi:hypothetical protein
MHQTPATHPTRRRRPAPWLTALAVPLAAFALPAHASDPDFGPNVKIYDPSTPASTIQADLDAAFNSQLRSPTAQFGTQRHAFLFKPGANGAKASYPVYANLGFYTAVAGVGQNPDDVTITGNVNVDAGWNFGDENNATQNFWRSAENLAVVPNGGTDRWAVSQAAPMRRVHIVGNLVLGPSNQGNPTGYASGGFIADSKVDGLIASGSQQQWLTRNSTLGNWFDGVWNMVFSGVVGAPSNSFPSPPYTTIATTPTSREKPYLYVDTTGTWRVFVPSLQSHSSGATWIGGQTPGKSIALTKFYIAKPSDSAATINTQLKNGKHLFLTPGTYHLSKPIHVTKAGTIVLGLGFPTLQPDNGTDAMDVDDVDGVKIAGLLFDAGTTQSPNLLRIGPNTTTVSHAANPISVQDTYFRIGGAVSGKAKNSLVVNSNDTLVDHVWAWRADHGSSPTGWTINTADNGVVINGANVLATGLFSEHYQKYSVLWNGENGKTIFFQNEFPYDPPSQSAWRSDGLGYAAYKVADNVKTHEAWGLGSYCFFNVDPSIHAAHGFEVPAGAPNVKFHDILTVSLGGVGVIDHVINETGGAAQGVSTQPVDVLQFP